MQFIDVETGKVLWYENFVGQAVKHHNGGKNFDDPWTRAFHESVDDSAKNISKRVNKYVDNVIFKGKSDKNFLPKKFSIGGLKSGKLFWRRTLRHISEVINLTSSDERIIETTRIISEDEALPFNHRL